MPVTEFAEKVGVPYSTFRAYGTGSRAPSPEVLAAIFLHFGFFPSWLLTGEGPRRVGELPAAVKAEAFVTIARHHVSASAGPGAVNSEDGSVNGLCFSRKWLNKKGLNPANLLVIDVVGDSMLGRLSEGDSVLIDRSQNTPKSGVAFVIRQGDELLVKYAQLLPNGVLRLSSENQTYKPYDVDLAKESDVSILGRVVASTHEW